MKLLRDAMKGFYRSGAAFTGAIVPRFFRRLGFSDRAAAVAGKIAGGAAGAATLFIGAQFLVALGLSVPMFGAVIGYAHAAGALIVAGAAAALAGTGVVLSACGLGMCRAPASDGLKQAAAAEQFLFRRFSKAGPDSAFGKSLSRLFRASVTRHAAPAAAAPAQGKPAPAPVAP